MSDLRGLALRGADAADAGALADLLRSAGREPASDGLAERIASLRSGAGAVLVAEAWGPLLGVAVASWGWTLERRSRLARLDLLVVEPNERRRGVGRRLLKAASQAARAAGCDELVLTAPPSAQDLRAFCLATGFHPAGEALSRGLRKQA